MHSDALQPGHDVDTEGDGDILRVTGLPQTGKRTVTVDTDEPDPRKKLIIDEHMDVYPHTYTVEYYGYHPNEVAISFDDGPDPKWTPKILDILKQKDVKGTFMMIGAEAQENIGLMQRVQREGHEIGNHTFFHPDISEISTATGSTSRSSSRSGSSPASSACSRSTSVRPTTSTRSPTPTTRPRPSCACSSWATPSSATRSIPTTGMSAIARLLHEITQFVLDQLEHHEDQAAVSRLRHPDARWRRRPLRHCRRAARAHRRAAREGLHHRSRLVAHGHDHRTGDAAADLRQYLRAIPDSIAFSALSIIGRFIVLRLLRRRRSR